MSSRKQWPTEVALIFVSEIIEPDRCTNPVECSICGWSQVSALQQEHAAAPAAAHEQQKARDEDAAQQVGSMSFSTDQGWASGAIRICACCLVRTGMGQSQFVVVTCHQAISLLTTSDMRQTFP